jgi:CBS domain-containing protein
MPGLFAKDVYEVAVRLPKTLNPSISLAQARAALDDDHVHMLLITDDRGRLMGTLVRSDLPRSGDDSARALDHAVLRDRTIAPDVPAEAARQVLVRRGERRLAVVDGDGRLLGLLCLKRRLTGFCSDLDVRARATSR